MTQQWLCLCKKKSFNVFSPKAIEHGLHFTGLRTSTAVVFTV